MKVRFKETFSTADIQNDKIERSPRRLVNMYPYRVPRPAIMGTLPIVRQSHGERRARTAYHRAAHCAGILLTFAIFQQNTL